jgi:hypothetical protein
MKDQEKPWTMDVPEAGRKYYGIGRSASYTAAKTGAMPVIWINGKVRALPRAIERQLEEAGAKLPPPPPQDEGPQRRPSPHATVSAVVSAPAKRLYTND